MVYSHDAFGLGNIRRMLAICNYLLKSIPNLSILLLSGSPMLQSFRLPEGLDYIKLPCINRGESGTLAAKYLNTDIEATIKLRSELILAAVRNFQPDLVLVDKKPYGIKGELKDTINYLKNYLPQSKLVLLLRDILNTPEKTIQQWQEENYYQAVESFYDQVLVVGMPEVFNLCQEYNFSKKIISKVHFCGYIGKETGSIPPHIIRQKLDIKPEEKLVLVTPGGGEDGYQLVNYYLTGIEKINNLIPDGKIRSLVICGSEMPLTQREQLYQLAATNSQVQIEDFTEDLMSYIAAADAVVCMGGYNTITEILQQGKRAIVVPRVKPSQEQLIRAQKMEQLGLISMIHPYDLSPSLLINTVLMNLYLMDNKYLIYGLDFRGLMRINNWIFRLLFNSYGNDIIESFSSNFSAELGLIIADAM
jgi:predicted glycosyltransferase